MIEGSIGKLRLTVAYLQNLAAQYIGEKANEYSGELSKDTSRFLIGTLNFDGMIPKVTSLRILAERGDINGRVEFKEAASTALTIEPFHTKWTRLGGWFINEGGGFWGVEYTTYQMPTMLGFSDSSRTVIYTAFDQGFKIEKFSLLVGIDTLAHTKRYETNYNQWYLSANLGVNNSWYTISDDIKRNVNQQTHTDKIIENRAISFEGQGEVGYLYQRRMKRVQGIGMAIQIGYRATASFYGSGQSPKHEPIKENALVLEFTRMDVLHGPFLQCSILF